MLELIPYAIVYKLLTITKTHWGESNITCTLSMHSKQIISPLKNPRQRIVYTHQSMIRLFNNIKQKERYTLSHSPPKTKLKKKKKMEKEKERLLSSSMHINTLLHILLNKYSHIYSTLLLSRIGPSV